MQILQITDTHLYGSASGRLRGVETDSSLHATLDDAFSRTPNYQAVLVTGDLVQDDKSGYLRFRSIFGNLVKPVLCIPGNHDEPETMHAELVGDPFKICGAHTIGDWTFVMLDSYDPGHVGGRADSTFNTIPAFGIPALNTAILLTSGVTVTIAHHALRAGHRGILKLFLALTFLLGFTFVSLQVHEYGEAYRELGLRLSTGIYGSTFFMLTGFHGLHVTIGAIMLTIIWLRTLRGHFTPRHHFAFEAVAWYWHFVDVVWLGLFVFVYWL